jgi:nicotinamide mononucleotide transporter
MQLLAHIFEQILAVLNFLFMTLEGISFVLALIYVVLSIAKKKLAWVFAVLAAASYAYICWQAELYPTMVLQAFFIILAIYGYYQWHRNDQKMHQTNHGNQANHEADIQRLNHFEHLIAMAICFVLFDAIRYLFLKAGMPFQSKIEILAVSASLVAQYLQAKSYQENWIWWLVINVLYVWINMNADLYLMALLYAILVVLSAHGWYIWQQKRNKNLINQVS